VGGTGQQQEINSRENNVRRREEVSSGVGEETSSIGTRKEQGILSKSQFFSLPQTTRQPHGDNLQEENDKREVTNKSNPLPSNSFLQRFITNYTQSREEPSQTLAERHRASALEDEWTTHTGRRMRMRGRRR
jgi:hypothetical protein